MSMSMLRAVGQKEFAKHIRHCQLVSQKLEHSGDLTSAAEWRVEAGVALINMGETENGRKQCLLAADLFNKFSESTGSVHFLKKAAQLYLTYGKEKMASECFARAADLSEAERDARMKADPDYVSTAALNGDSLVDEIALLRRSAEKASVASSI